MLPIHSHATDVHIRLLNMSVSVIFYDGQSSGGSYRDYSVASYMSSCDSGVAKEDTRVLELNKYTYLCLNIENLRQ